MTKRLNKQDIEKADATPRVVELDVPEWGGSVFIGIMSGEDRERWEIESKNLNNFNVRATLIARTLVDENGNRLFTDQDVEKINKKSWKPIQRIFDKSVQVNLIGDDNIEKQAKNS